jgi:hypothetical protein
MKTLAPDSLEGRSRDSTADREQYLMKITQNCIQWLAWDYLRRKKQKALICFSPPLGLFKELFLELFLASDKELIFVIIE